MFLRACEKDRLLEVRIKEAELSVLAVPTVENEEATLMKDAPATFDEFYGQQNVIELIRTHVVSAKQQRTVVPHILLEGPGGTGKTTIAMCVANEIGSGYFITTPSTFKDKDAVTNFFFEKDGTPKVEEGDIVFIDEIHRVREAAAIYLYSLMQDFYMDIGNGEIREIPPITFIGATTDLGMLPSPFRDRFPIRAVLERYDENTIAEIIQRNKPISMEIAQEIAKRSCGIPRIAKALLSTVMAVTISNGSFEVTMEEVNKACSLMEIDSLGLNKNARRVIEYFKSRNNTPAGSATLASTINISRETLEHEVFPVLFAHSLLESKGTRGKALTEKGIGYAS